jgi:hypothetical protein
MTQDHHTSPEHHRHPAQHCKKESPLERPAANAHEESSGKEAPMPVIHDELTVYTEDGKWKAVFKAWKDYWLFYNSIGAEVDVYERRETHDIWGHRTTDWVKAKADIYMVANFQGQLRAPSVPQNPPVPPNGGMGNLELSRSFRDSHAELRLWAAGFFTTNITVSGEQTTPAGATLDINSVIAEIEVSTPSGPLHGTVGASSYLSDNSAWG